MITTSATGLRRLTATQLSDAVKAADALLKPSVRESMEPILATKLDSFHADLLSAYEDVARDASREMGAPVHPESGPHSREP